MATGCTSSPSRTNDDPRLRMMTYHLSNIETADLQRTDHTRLRRAAARIQSLSPDVLFVTGLVYDQSGLSDNGERTPGQNGRRFVTNYLSRSQADTLSGRSYQTVMLPVNAEDSSREGRITDQAVSPETVSVSGSSESVTAVRRAHPGRANGSSQEGMALFVRDDLEILRDSIRTFRRFLWSKMPGAARPRDRHSGAPWHSDETWRSLRLSSRSHWDVPVRTSGGTVIHVLASHPGVPTRDGDAQYSDRRNHDEIRFWVDYLDDAVYIEDDSGRGGGLAEDAAFVLVGPLHADPNDKNIFRAAVRELIAHRRVHDPRPTASLTGRSPFPNLSAQATARWGGRRDYVLPSKNLLVDTSGVWRPVPDTAAVPVSDRFPVWVDFRLPEPPNDVLE